MSCALIMSPGVKRLSSFCFAAGSAGVKWILRARAGGTATTTRLASTVTPAALTTTPFLPCLIECTGALRGTRLPSGLLVDTPAGRLGHRKEDPLRAALQAALLRAAAGRDQQRPVAGMLGV